MRLLTTVFLVFFLALANAQTGSYTYKNKASNTTINLDLRRDGVFLYQYQKDWVSTETRGNWHPLNNGQVALTSEYQLSDYKLEASQKPQTEGIHVVIRSTGKNQSPTTIHALYLNEDETANFQLDGEAGMKFLEQRQRQLVAGSAAVRDSLKNTDLPRFYVYPNAKKVTSITLVFDGQELTIPIENEAANTIVLTTSFAPHSAYKYMKEQVFIKKGDFINEVGSAIKLKKNKH